MAAAAGWGLFAVLLLTLALEPAAVRADRLARRGTEPEAASSAVFPLYGDVYPHGCVPLVKLPISLPSVPAHF
jgi:hypothetical protein